MDLYKYYQTCDTYFWQWEEEGEVIAIPGETTIAYKDFVNEILVSLAPQGIPPFGSLLLAIMATNPNANAQLDLVHSIMDTKLGISNSEREPLTGAMKFLRILSEIPQDYKKGEKRMLVFQTIFEGSHNTISFKNATKLFILNQLNQSLSYKTSFMSLYNNDFSVIKHLLKKFKSVDDILHHMAPLPVLEEELDLLPDTKESKDKDLIELLIENENTYHIGSLVKRIWSGLNIPFHNTQPSSQPLGGFSDLTNKGEYDRLLLSEYANDDLVLMSRLANNEALYLLREIPPARHELKRILLIDVSLKTWGTPKAIAFATMLAIARHPKTDIDCSVFALGNAYYPVSIDSIHTIIEALQVLEPSLNASQGLRAFFKDHPDHRNRELFFITEPSTLKQSEILKAVNDFHAFITYWIYTDVDGHIDVYRKQQNSKKHLQHLRLPLEDLWKKEPRKKKVIATELTSDFPILFMSTSNFKKVLITSDGEIFQITKEKTLLRLFDKGSNSNSKGWELVYQNLPFTDAKFEIGLMDNGDYILLIYNVHNREISFITINTGEKKTIFFYHWQSNGYHQFLFYDNCFHYPQRGYAYSIDPITLEIVGESKDIIPFYDERAKELAQINARFIYGANVLKSIKTVYINDSNNLVFNKHEMILSLTTQTMNVDGANFNDSQSFAVLKPTKNPTKKRVAEFVNKTEFVFEDGTSVEINRNGMLILKSSNTLIPTIYIPTTLDWGLGIATDTVFAGNKFYLKEPVTYVRLHTPGNDKSVTKGIISSRIGHIYMHQMNQLLDNSPNSLLSCSSPKVAIELISELKKAGATAEMVPLEQNKQVNFSEVIPVSDFFNQYIQKFVTTILSYGTDS